MDQRFPEIHYAIAPEIRAALLVWINEGHLPGDFLQSVLRNDLAGAVTRADPFNLATLREIVWFLQMEAPSPCWGSAENVQAWAAHKEQERGGLA